MPSGFPEDVEPPPQSVIMYECGDGSTSSGKLLGIMHTLNSPMISSTAIPPAIMAIASSVVQDVLFGILSDFVH